MKATTLIQKEYKNWGIDVKEIAMDFWSVISQKTHAAVNEMLQTIMN